MQIRKVVYHSLLKSNKIGDLSWFVDLFIIGLILLNVVAILLQSIPTLDRRFYQEFEWFELFSIVVFTAEYLLRLWTANLNPKFHKPISGTIRYTFTPMAIIDLLSVLPFYLAFVGMDLRLLRIMRVFKIFRLFKIARYISALNIINHVFRKKREELVISLIFTLFLLLIASTLMYYVENEVQPDVFSSIPHTMWWGIATLTTVGYGDVYPITPLGHLLGGIIALFGIGLFALPTGILASGFSQELEQKRRNKSVCPTCGQKLPHATSTHEP